MIGAFVVLLHLAQSHRPPYVNAICGNGEECFIPKPPEDREYSDGSLVILSATNQAWELDRGLCSGPRYRCRHGHVTDPCETHVFVRQIRVCLKCLEKYLKRWEMKEDRARDSVKP